MSDGGHAAKDDAWRKGFFVKPPSPSLLNWPAPDGRGGEERETGGFGEELI
jgi:hypothetical protein